MGAMQVISRYYIKSKRLLLKQTRRPSRKELSITSRIVALGILLIGAVGFIIDLVISTFIVSTPS